MPLLCPSDDTGGAAKGPCVLQAVLSSSSDRSMMVGNGRRRMQEMWLDVQVVLPHESQLTVAVADTRSTLHTQ